VIRVEMADRKQRQIRQSRAGFGEAQVGAATRVDHHDGLAVTPDQVAARRAISRGEGTA
jgi:hypothetical protein